jgi:hypothetical protein
MAFDKPLLVLRCLKKLKKTDYNEFDIKLMTLKVLAYCKTIDYFSLEIPC